MADIHVPAGFNARPIEPDTDAESVVELCNAAAIAEYGTGDATLQLVRESYGSPSFHPETDGRLVLDADGRFAAIVEYYDNTDDHVAPFVFTRIRPDLLEAGIGEALLAWAERRGAATVALAEPDLRIALHANAAGVNEQVQRILERSGWDLARIYWTMEIELGDHASVGPTLPAGITIRSAVRDVDEPAIHAAEQEAFADHYGNVPQPLERWLHFLTRLFPYDPDLWFLAVENEEIAGIALCRPEATGRPEMGWVQILGVRPAWRGRGLGLALLKHAFAEFHRLGKQSVGLTVDSQSLTGATRLYERAGMHVARDERSYERVLRDGREIRPT